MRKVQLERELQELLAQQVRGLSSIGLAVTGGGQGLVSGRCSYHAVTMQLLCSYHAVTMQFPCCHRLCSPPAVPREARVQQYFRV